MPKRGRGNSIVVSISVYQAGHPDLHPTLSACFRKVGFYQDAIYLFPPVLTTGSTKTVHVFSCLCDNTCKRSLTICHKIRASCPVSRLLSVPIWPACDKQGRKYEQTNKQTNVFSLQQVIALCDRAFITRQGK